MTWKTPKSGDSKMQEQIYEGQKFHFWAIRYDQIKAGCIKVNDSGFFVYYFWRLQTAACLAFNFGSFLVTWLSRYNYSVFSEYWMTSFKSEESEDTHQNQQDC